MRGREERRMVGCDDLGVAEKIVLLLAYCNMNPEHMSSCACLRIGAMMATHNEFSCTELLHENIALATHSHFTIHLQCITFNYTIISKRVEQAW